MAKYINSADVIDIIQKYFDETDLSALSDAAKEINLLQSADVAPVVHGEWVWNTKGLFPKPLCSRCNYEPYRASNHNSDLPNYCPNCGAKMDRKAVK